MWWGGRRHSHSLCFLFQAPGLQNCVKDHSNIIMFNFIAYPIFLKSIMILTPTPPETINSRPPPLKEHKCLSVIQFNQGGKQNV